MYTEDEARKKWCPFVRAAYAKNSTRMRPDLGEDIAEHLPMAVVGNRPHDGVCSCIASDCMAWQSRNEKQTDKSHSAEIERPKPWEPLEPARMTGSPLAQETYKREFILRQGYCGLAGKPE